MIFTITFVFVTQIHWLIILICIVLGTSTQNKKKFNGICFQWIMVSGQLVDHEEREKWSYFTLKDRIIKVLYHIWRQIKEPWIGIIGARKKMRLLEYWVVVLLSVTKQLYFIFFLKSGEIRNYHFYPGEVFIFQWHSHFPLRLEES